MTFFSGFPEIDYKFGDENYSVLFQNLSAYVDLIDRLKEDTSFYTKYTILEGDRPDTVSHILYETTNYYWTFYLLNDNLRQLGWPLTNRQLREKIQRTYSGTTLVTRNELLDSKFNPGREITGLESGVTGVVKSKNLNIGQIVVQGQQTFYDGEIVQTVLTQDEIDNGVLPVEFTLVSSSDEYNSAFYYTLDGVITDIDPYVGPGALLAEVTYMDHFIEKNDQNRIIKVLRPEVVNQVFSAYKKELTGL